MYDKLNLLQRIQHLKLEVAFMFQGDTGNPAVHFSGMNRAGTLYGIALFSGMEECAFKSKPGVFAKVYFFILKAKSKLILFFVQTGW